MSNKILLVGGGGREDAVSRRLAASGSEVYAVMKNRNPSIFSRCRDVMIHDELDVKAIVEFAVQNSVDLAFVGPDPVLNTGLVDLLTERGIRVASPSSSAAKIETSKEFMRDFVSRNNIPGNIDYRVIREDEDLQEFLGSAEKDYAIKPLGLTGGKGVKVMGIHLHSPQEAMDYARSIMRKDGRVLLEERISGEEFSQQVLTDGTGICPFPIVQDYKRAFENDQGPNTGGMGAISGPGGSLPFISDSVRKEALEIMRAIVTGLKNEGTPFKGVMYGQFMQVDGNAKIVEINARFADPEGINVLTLLEDDLAELLNEVADGNLRKEMKFSSKASVLKYVVPPGYGVKPEPGVLDVTEGSDPDFLIYYAAVSGTVDHVEMTTSRSLALVALADTIPEASEKIEENLWRINGKYFMRHDIGTKEMIEKKIQQVS